jgi:NTP pyrophosphatase (non-canonical NTP hydrolase)
VKQVVGTLLNTIAIDVHTLNRRWWVDLETGQPIERNIPECLCLVHSEISEAMEGHRKHLQDDKLPHRPMIEVELADAMIRILDLAAALNLDIGGAFLEKLKFNETRADHSREARLAPGGKKY